MIRSKKKSRVLDLLVRALLTLLYIAVLFVVVWLALAALVIRWALLLAERDNLNLLDQFCHQLVSFFVQASQYILMLSSEWPFPFNPIPTISTVVAEVVSPPADETAADKTAKATTGRKKAAAAKKKAGSS